jgi:hypothetical protein
MGLHLAPLLLCLLAPQEPVVYMGRAFVFEADLEEGRARGWIAAEAEDEDVLAGVRQALEDRLRTMGRFAEARVEREEGGRFAAIFVGDQQQALEDMIVAGLGNAGRLELRLAAVDADLGRAGATLATERARLERRRAEHPDAALAHFDEGAVVWRAPRGGGEPRALCREPLELLRRADFPPGLRVVRDVEAPLGLSFTLLAELGEALAGRLKGRDERTLVVLLNDEIVSTRPPAESFELMLSAGEGYSLEDARALIAAVGNPLDAPLRFVERTKRELEQVKRRKP